MLKLLFAKFTMKQDEQQDRKEDTGQNTEPKPKDVVVYHQSKDWSIVKAVIKMLEEQSVSCWTNYDVPYGGSYLMDQGYMHQNCKCIVLFLSKNFWQAQSGFCCRELDMSIHEETLQGRNLKLLIVFLDKELTENPMQEFYRPQLQPIQHISAETKNHTYIAQCLLEAYKGGVDYSLNATLQPSGNNRKRWILNGLRMQGADIQGNCCSCQTGITSDPYISARLAHVLGLKVPQEVLDRTFQVLAQTRLIKHHFLLNCWFFFAIFALSVMLFFGMWYGLEAAVALQYDLSLPEVRYTYRIWPYPLALQLATIFSTVVSMSLASWRFNKEWSQTVECLNTSLNPDFNILLFRSDFWNLTIYKADLRQCKIELRRQLSSIHPNESDTAKLEQFIKKQRLLNTYVQNLNCWTHVFPGSKHRMRTGECFCTMVQRMQAWQAFSEEVTITVSTANGMEVIPV